MIDMSKEISTCSTIIVAWLGGRYTRRDIAAEPKASLRYLYDFIYQQEQQL